jgi:RNA polymerase sigma-70 factor (ECF subfamily)
MDRPPVPGSASAGEVSRWLAAARSGSPEALGQALDACRQYLLLIAQRQLGEDLRGKVGASDLVQETFVEAMRDFGRFHGRTEQELLAWLGRILQNNVANVGRHYRLTEKRELRRELGQDDLAPQRVLDDLPSPLASPSWMAAHLEETSEFERVLTLLPDDYRLVIRLRHQERLPFEEVGQRLGRTADAARKLWARAVERLHEVLGPDHERE